MVNLKTFGIELGDRDSFRRHTWLFAQPIVVGLLAVCVTSIFRYWTQTHFHPEDREYIITGPLAVLAIFHSVIAGHMIMDVVRRHRDVIIAIRRKDQEKFEDNRCFRLPGFLKLFLGILSTILVAYVSLIRFHYVWAEQLSVFSVTWVLSMFWVIITELEDPVNGAWFGKQVPEEWLQDEAE
jgi:hypothetical protein